MFSDAIHKLVTALTSPFNVGMILFFIGVVRLFVKRRDSHGAYLLYLFMLFVFSWFWIWSMPIVSSLMGLSLERPFPPRLAQDMPTANAICILGGGMCANTNLCPYADMGSCADRVWHGARLYNAGKAMKITLTGPDVGASTAPLLRDLGVPDSAFVFFEYGRNTEDEARMISNWLKTNDVGKVGVCEGVGKVLLVTSAWHMRRAKWLFEREGLEVIPAATDHETSVRSDWHFYELKMWLPAVGCYFASTLFFKEHFAYWCYRLTDKFSQK